MIPKAPLVAQRPLTSYQISTTYQFYLGAECKEAKSLQFLLTGLLTFS